MLDQRAHQRPAGAISGGDFDERGLHRQRGAESGAAERASEVGGRVAAAPPEVRDLLNSAGRKCLKEEIKFPPQQQDQVEDMEVVEDVQAPRSAERRQRVPQARQCGPKGGRGKAKAKVETRRMRKRRREDNRWSWSDSDSLEELSDGFEDFGEDALESDIVTASEIEQDSTLPVPPRAARLPYASPSDMPERNATEKWYKEFIMELFVPAEVDAAVEKYDGPGPTWFTDSEEEAPPPKPKPRRITKTEKKRAQIEALLRVGTRVPVIMETLGVAAGTVYKVNKLMKEAFEENREPDLAVQLGAGRPLKRCPEFLMVLKDAFTSAPMTSYKFMAKQLGVSKKTVSRGVKDLGMRSYIMRYRALITSGARVKRVERAEELLEWISAHPNAVIIFSDEKKFTIDSSRNRQNDR